MKLVHRYTLLMMIVGATVVLWTCCSQSYGQAVIKLNPQITYQTMSGWEATAQAGETASPAFNNYQDRLVDAAVNDLGINRLRLELRSGLENPVDYFQQFIGGQLTYDQWKQHNYEIINDNNDPFVINSTGFQFSDLDYTIDKVVLPIQHKLAGRGEKLFLNLNYVDFSCCRGASTIRHNARPDEYAEFILATYLHMQSKYGLVPDAVEVILEPDNNTGWTATQVGQAVVATGNRLRANNFTPAFIVGSTTNAANAPSYIDQIAAVPGAMGYVSEFSYHRYCCASEEVLQNIASRAMQYGKRIGMLELIGADHQILHQDIKLGRNSAWQQYTLAGPTSWGPDDGSRYYIIDDAKPAAPILMMGSRTKFLRQYFKYVRAGAVRIEAASDNAGVDPLAFINTTGKYVVVVKASAGGALQVQGLPAGTYGIKYTTGTQYDMDAADVIVSGAQALTTKIPAAGVLTIYGKAVSTASAPVLKSMTPTNALAGGNAFTLTLNGANFTDATIAQWNNSSRPTQFVSTDQLTASITAADIDAPGTARVRVVDAAGQTSNDLDFTVSPPPVTIHLFTESDRGVALDSVTWQRDPFPVSSSINFSADGRTRIILFASNLELPLAEGLSAMTAQAEEGAHTVFPLTVEYVGKVPGLDWLSYVIVKLNEKLEAGKDVLVSVALRGVASNQVRIGIRPE